MRTITLDGQRMVSIQETHAYIEKKLEIHDYYGKNLDALWDSLTSIDGRRCGKHIFTGCFFIKKGR